jgi:hypothetical protein
MWEERLGEQGQGAVWRFQIEELHTGRQRGFDSLPSLFAYLQGVVAHGEGEAFGRYEAEQ